MRVPIGEMREPVVVLSPLITVDESGGEVVGYGVSDPIFVAIRAVSTREALSFGQLDASVTHICHGHWNDLHSVISNNRIRMLETSVEFDIVGPPIESPVRDWVRLTLVRRENG